MSSTFTAAGNREASSTVVTNQLVTLTGGGDCGWNAPTGAPTNPFNKNGWLGVLTVEYLPP